MRYLIAIVIIALASMTACGGSSSSPPSSSTPPPSSSTGGTVGPPAPLNSPSIVTVVAGQPSSGVNIQVGSPASTTPPNAQDLGVAAVGTAQASAFNTGDVIHRGATNMMVLLFGPGLNGSMKVAINGPPDIHIDSSSVTGITASDKTPGISFIVTSVDSTAALGARTVVLQNSSNNDVTTFTGGLEVVP